ncbi:MAG: hypothetical protein KAR87_02375 [Candidatus Aenigmarchaeota archaeon]|nr:hypothetical protein [Candidatus Aenigmarchaeota archaeon]
MYSCKNNHSFKRYGLFVLIALVVFISGCDEPVRTTDLLYVDYLNIYPSNLLNTNDIAQIRLRVTNTGHSPAQMVLEERKIKKYLLWISGDGTERIFREGNSWFSWDGTDANVMNYAEYLMESSGEQVTLIAPDRTEILYDISEEENITLINGRYTTEPYELENKTKEELAIDSILPPEDSSKFIASSVLAQYCGSLYGIKDFNVFPNYRISLFEGDIKTETIGKKDTKYAQSVIVGRQILLEPKDSIELVWKIKAPSNDDTSGLMQPCRFHFNVKYSAEAKSESHIYFANPLEIIQKSITDKEMSMKGNTVRTFGPMSIEIEPTTKQPIESSTGTDDEERNRWTIKLIVSNKGAGYGHIKTLSLDVNKNPSDIFGRTGLPLSELNEYFCDFRNNGNLLEIKDSMNKDDEGENKIYLNKLDIYKSKTSEIRCTLDAPEVNIMEPYRFTAKAKYDYIIQGYLDVKTKPEREI